MPQINPEFLSSAIQHATFSVFETMLGSNIQLIDPATESGESEGGLVSLVCLTGPWIGTGSLCCSALAAVRISERMLMVNQPPAQAAVTDEVMDAIAEIANMIVGNIKHLVEELAGPMAIGIPTVVFGKNFRFKSLTGAASHSVFFEWEKQRLEVRLNLTPSNGTTSSTRYRQEAQILHPV